MKFGKLKERLNQLGNKTLGEACKDLKNISTQTVEQVKDSKTVEVIKDSKTVENITKAKETICTKENLLKAIDLGEKAIENSKPVVEKVMPVIDSVGRGIVCGAIGGTVAGPIGFVGGLVTGVATSINKTDKELKK